MPALGFTKTIVEKGVESEMLSSLVMYMVRELLLNHGNWKYQQPHQRWQITTQVFLQDLLGDLCKCIVFSSKEKCSCTNTPNTENERRAYHKMMQAIGYY